MQKIIKKFIKQNQIDPEWLFRVRLSNGEETGPYTFSHLADLLLEGALTGDEEIAWYPQGEWIVLSAWDLFHHLLKAFVGSRRATKDQREHWKRLIDRYHSPIALPHPREREETALIEPEEREWTPRVEKTFVREELEFPEIPAGPSFFSRVIPKVLLLVLVGGLIFLLLFEPAPRTKPTVAIVNVQVPSIEKPVVDDEKAKTYFENAQELFNEDTPIAYQQASEELLRSLGFDPKNRDARLLLSETYAFLWPLTDQGSKTFSLINSLIEQTAETPGVFRVQARLAFSRGEIERAKTFVKQASDDDYQAELLKAEISIYEGKPKEATQKIQTILEIQPEYIRAQYQLGVGQEKQKEPEEAIETFERALSLNPRHGPSRLQLGLLELQVGKIGPAEEALKQVTQFPSFVFPDQLASAHYYLGRIYEERQQIDFAIREFQQALKNNPLDDLSKQALVRVGGEEALEKIEQANIKEQGADYYVSLGNRYLQENRPIDAMAQYRLALQVDPKSAIAFYHLGKSYAEQNDFQQAIQNLQQAVQHDPRLVRGFLVLAEIFTKSYRFKNAEEVLQRARQLEPANPEVYLVGGKIYEQKGEYNRTKFEYSRAAELDPKSAQAQIALGRSYLHFEEWDSAIKHFQKAAELNPNLEDANVNLAEAVFRKGFQAKAVKFLKERLAAQPLNAKYYRGLGKLYDLSGSEDLAIDQYRRAIQLDPKNSSNYLDLAQVYLNQDSYVEALYFFGAATKVDPNNVEGYFNQAFVLYQMGQYDGAVKSLQEVVRRNELYPKVHFNLARIYTLLGHKKEAEIEFKKEIQFNPDLPDTYESHLALGDIYYGLEDYVPAKEQYEKAIKINPSLTSAYLNLGRSYRALGLLEPAEEIFTALLKLDPNFTDAWKDLGSLAEGRENNELAIKAYEEYLLRNPAAVDAQEIREKIEKLTNIYKPIP
ncbi:MAG TPA: tetratricopeptide repeat protein [Bdellovibrionota bacterium]|nr:tetratricopeptide repeat protein [Bdellovibrionota bacterium]